MKALSIRQPWAWAIVHAGKDIENRDWAAGNPGLRFRGPFLIHASKGMTEAERFDFGDFYLGLPGHMNLPDLPDGEFERGGIVGIAEIADVVQAHESPWFSGPVGLIIRNARPLPFAPLKGQLGFFEVPASFWNATPAEVPFQ